MAFDERGPWIPMKKVLEHDPYFAKLKATERDYPLPGRKLPAIILSPHLWKAALPNGLGLGTQTIIVREVDLHGRTRWGRRVITVLE